MSSTTVELSAAERTRLAGEFEQAAGKVQIPGGRWVEWETNGDELWAEVTYEERFDYDGCEMTWPKGWPSYRITSGICVHQEESWPDTFADALLHFVEYNMTNPRRR